MPVEMEFDPDVFHGELTANHAHLFVRVPRTPDLANCTLHGYVHGPRCEYAHSLPARFALQDLGVGPTLLARATLTDPCLWTSDLPQLYDVQVELRRGTEVIAREKRMLGLRGIGVHKGPSPRLVREAKTWVPRGVALELLESPDAVSLREELLVGICSLPPLDLLVEASRRGLYLIARLDAERQDLPAALRNLARWPAVLMAVIRGGAKFDRSLQQVAPNLLLAQEVDLSAPQGPDALEPRPWATALVAELEPGKTLQSAGEINASLPWLFLRSVATGNLSPAEARAECDRLQRDLAPAGQFGGYLIAAATSPAGSAS